MFHGNGEMPWKVVRIRPTCNAQIFWKMRPATFTKSKKLSVLIIFQQVIINDTLNYSIYKCSCIFCFLKKKIKKQMLCMLTSWLMYQIMCLHLNIKTDENRCSKINHRTKLTLILTNSHSSNCNCIWENQLCFTCVIEYLLQSLCI